MITIEKNLNGYDVIAVDGVIIPHQTIGGLHINADTIILESFIDERLPHPKEYTTIILNLAELITLTKKYWIKYPKTGYSTAYTTNPNDGPKTIKLYLDINYFESYIKPDVIIRYNEDHKKQWENITRGGL